MSKLDKITRVLVQPSKNIVLKLHCKLSKTVNGAKHDCNNFFDYGDNTYLKMEHSVFMTLEILDDTEWEKSKNLLITSKNLFQVQQTLKTMLNIVKSGEIFKTKKNVDKDGGISYELFVYNEDVKENTIVVKLLGDSNSRLAIQPCIVYNECEEAQHGVRLMINKQINIVEITVEQLESLYYNLMNVDFFLYGQSLINYYMTYLKESNISVKPQEKKSVGVVFNKPKEQVSSSLVKESSTQDMFMMNNIR